MDKFKETKCPFLSGVKLGDFGSFLLGDNSLYRKLVGSLLYLTHSRPDLAYELGVIEIYMKYPHDIHWKDAKKDLALCARNQTIRGTLCC